MLCAGEGAWKSGSGRVTLRTMGPDSNEHCREYGYNRDSANS